VPVEEGKTATYGPVLRQYHEYGLRSHSKFTQIAMMQPTDARNRNDLAHFARLDRPLFWGVLC
jgi:hypothetical protein